MTPKKKKKLTYITIGIFFLLQGVEYAVILPTLWLYIHTRFHGESYMLGFVLSAFSFAGLVASPIMGRWSDRTGNTKSVLLVANLLQIAGSAMYVVGLSDWFLVAARLVAGLGSGVGSAIFADIARVTTVEERTGVMSVFMAVRQMGLLLGPGCNLFLRQLDFKIGPVLVDKYSSPGLLMVCVWILHEILTVFMYWNLPALKLEETLSKQQLQGEDTSSQANRHIAAVSSLPAMESPLVHPSPSFSINSASQSPSLRHRDRYTSHSVRSPVTSDPEEDPAYLTSSNEIIEDAERYMGPVSSTLTPQTAVTDDRPRARYSSQSRTSYGAINNSESPAVQHLYDTSVNSGIDSSYNDCTDISSQGPASEEASFSATHSGTPTKLSFRFVYNEFIREEVIAVLFTSFVSFFNQIGIETLFTPLSNKLLDWGELENSILYCAAGAEVILVFFLVRFLSRRLSDKWLLLIGFLLLTSTISVCTWFIPQAKPGDYKTNFAGLSVLVFFDVFALPFLAVPSASLYSKITRPETQGFAQGIRRIFVSSGAILGPLWTASLYQHLQINFAVMLSVCFIPLVMLLVSFKHLTESRYTRRSRSRAANKSAAAPSGVTVRSWEETQNEQRSLLPATS